MLGGHLQRFKNEYKVATAAFFMHLVLVSAQQDIQVFPSMYAKWLPIHLQEITVVDRQL